MVRVSLAYLAIAWLIIQLVGEIGPILELPDWFPRIVLGLLTLGFPITVVLAWIYELTNKGLRRTQDVDRDASLHSMHGRWLDFVIIATLLMALGYFIWESRFADEPSPSGKVESVAVLPFHDLSEAQDRQFLADGIAEELINALSRVANLKVAGRSSSFSFRGEQTDLKSITETLHVSHILEGSVRVSGDRLRVSAQLVNGADGFQVWTREFDGRMEDVFRVQDELARLVVNAFETGESAPPGKPMPGARATSIDAYNAYLLGRHELAQRSATGIRQAIEHFKQAVALDPTYAPAYSGLAKTLVISPYYVQLMPPRELFIQARELAQKSIELDAGNSESYSVLGTISMVFDRHWKQAEEQLRRSVEIHPNDASNLNLLGDYLYTVGDYLAALEIEGRTVELEPLSAANQHELALVNLLLARYDEAIALELLAVQLNPEFSNAWGSLARIYLFTGRTVELQELLASGDAHFSYPFSLWLDVLIEADSGDLDQKEQNLLLLADLGQRGEVSPTFLAFLYASLGDDINAALWLSIALDAQDPILVSPLYFFLPEDWPELPLVRAALERPGLEELYQLRRQYIAGGSGRVSG